jgi:rubrerythrin
LQFFKFYDIIYIENEKGIKFMTYMEDKSEPEIEVWFCKSCGRTVRKNPVDGPSAWCPKCWKPYTIQYRKADFFDGSKELSKS